MIGRVAGQDHNYRRHITSMPEEQRDTFRLDRGGLTARIIIMFDVDPEIGAQIEYSQPKDTRKAALERLFVPDSERPKTYIATGWALFGPTDQTGNYHRVNKGDVITEIEDPNADERIARDQLPPKPWRRGDPIEPDL